MGEKQAPVLPVVSMGMKRLDSEQSLQSHSFAPSGLEEDDIDSSSQMDDLMFMLKTNTSYSQEDVDSPGGGRYDGGSIRKPSASEQYQLRRISIADTHL